MFEKPVAIAVAGFFLFKEFDFQVLNKIFVGKKKAQKIPRLIVGLCIVDRIGFYANVASRLIFVFSSPEMGHVSLAMAASS